MLLLLLCPACPVLHGDISETKRAIRDLLVAKRRIFGAVVKSPKGLPTRTSLRYVILVEIDLEENFVLNI